MSRHRRVRPIVALTLLDTLRMRDRPQEFLRQEDPSVTLPRRLGLSTVVSSQIEKYERAVKTRELLREDEVANLVALVLRREDGRDVMRTVGERLASDLVPEPGWRRALPAALRRWWGRRAVAGVARGLFRELRARSDRGLLVLEAPDHFLLRAAPDGGACDAVAGLSDHGMGRAAGERWHATHDACAGQGAPMCTWTVHPYEDTEGD